MATERIRIPIDRQGRIVLPKEVREHHGLAGGSEFEVIEEPDRIILKPVPQGAKLVNKGGVLVAVPNKAPSISIPDFIRQQREERIKKFL